MRSLFRRAQRFLTERGTNLALSASLLLPAACTSALTPGPHQNTAALSSPAPFVLAGYNEYPLIGKKWPHKLLEVLKARYGTRKDFADIRETTAEEALAAKTELQEYRKGKPELLLQMAACQLTSPHHCNPNIKIFALMLNKVKEIPNPLTRMEVINAWVNSFIAYDYKEANSTSPNRSLSRTLEDRQGICQEMADLKLFALEYINFKPGDLRSLGETIYHSGQYSDFHAVILVRLGSEIWVLDDQEAPDVTPPVRFDDVKSAIRDLSSIETYPGSINYNKQGLIAKIVDSPNDVVLPVDAINSRGVYLYDGIGTDTLADDYIPYPARHARAKGSSITISPKGRNGTSDTTMNALLPALPQAYKKAYESVPSPSTP